MLTRAVSLCPVNLPTAMRITRHLRWSKKKGLCLDLLRVLDFVHGYR